MASYPPPAEPASPPGDAQDGTVETHYEWMARTLAGEDRRVTPFVYRASPGYAERRRWDALASFAAHGRSAG